jgi:hypothetical protein
VLGCHVQTLMGDRGVHILVAGFCERSGHVVPSQSFERRRNDSRAEVLIRVDERTAANADGKYEIGFACPVATGFTERSFAQFLIQQRRVNG